MTENDGGLLIFIGLVNLKQIRFQNNICPKHSITQIHYAASIVYTLWLGHCRIGDSTNYELPDSNSISLCLNPNFYSILL
jgi:hypothetical protein